MVAIITPSQPSTGQLKINHEKRSPVKKISWTEKESQSRNTRWRKICSRGCHEHLPIVKHEQMLAICGAGCEMSAGCNMSGVVSMKWAEKPSWIKKMQERKGLSLAKAKCKNQVGLMCDQPRNVECRWAGSWAEQNLSGDWIMFRMQLQANEVDKTLEMLQLS